jgi:hypothetical protein
MDYRKASAPNTLQCEGPAPVSLFPRRGATGAKLTPQHTHCNTVCNDAAIRAAAEEEV